MELPKLVQSFPNQNANPSITGLTRTLKRGNVLLQDLLTGLCSHDSQSSCLSSQFQGFMTEGGFGEFSNLYSKAPLLNWEAPILNMTLFYLSPSMNYKIACVVPFVLVAILLYILGCKVPGYLVTLFSLPPVLLRMLSSLTNSLLI